jgi:hypothetical protein
MRLSLALALLAAPVPVLAQGIPSGDLEAFVTAVRASTARYQDQAVALQDGYRKIGPDFPSMGEHWLNRAIVMRGVIDPMRPPILEYISVEGRPVLAGVAYAQLAYEEAPQSPIPAPSSAWHYHAGSVDEESFIASHAEGGARDSSRGPRIAVLHAWLWVENPAGLFATDNWLLPWLRLAVPSPVAQPGPDSLTMMAALAAGGEHYFSTLIRLRHRLGPEATERVKATLGKFASRLGPGRRSPAELGQAWLDLERELGEVCAGCSLTGHAH